MASNPRKEALYVRVKAAEDLPVFINVSDHIGRDYPFASTRNLKATCALRVTDSTVAFALTHTTKAKAGRITEAKLALPRGNLRRLEARADDLAGEHLLPQQQIHVDFQEQTYRFAMTRDDAGVASITAIGEELGFELPRHDCRIDVFLRSPVVDRILAVGFSGYFNRPAGTPETLTRATGLILNSLLGLGDFRMLARIEHVSLPAAPAGPAPAARETSERVRFHTVVQLVQDDSDTVLGRGPVDAEIDLDHVNPATGQLLYHVAIGEGFQWNPDLPEALDREALFGRYTAQIAEAVGHLVRQNLGTDEEKSINYDIVLGAVTAGTADRLNQAVAGLPVVEMTTTRWRAV